MKSINPNADYKNLQLSNAFQYQPYEFKNDIGQRITFFEDPTLGEEGCVWVAFPEHSVAFRSNFYETDDMTLKTGSVFSFLECVENRWSPDEDMDYVPRLVDGKMLLKFDTE
jgi:hypothetical protein